MQAKARVPRHTHLEPPPLLLRYSPEDAVTLSEWSRQGPIEVQLDAVILAYSRSQFSYEVCIYTRPVCLGLIHWTLLLCVCSSRSEWREFADTLQSLALTGHELG